VRVCHALTGTCRMGEEDSRKEPTQYADFVYPRCLQ
jgi:hypothetical protein